MKKIIINTILLFGISVISNKIYAQKLMSDQPASQVTNNAPMMAAKTIEARSSSQQLPSDGPVSKEASRQKSFSEEKQILKPVNKTIPDQSMTSGASNTGTKVLTASDQNVTPKQLE